MHSLRASIKAPPRRGAPATVDDIVRAVEAFDLDRLKTRTLEVVLCVLEGDAVAEIAQFIDASPSTVRRHLARFREQAGMALPV